VLAKLKAALSHKLFYLWNLYPPFLGAGIRIIDISADLSRVRVKLSLYPWNKNYVGTQFGGSLYMMCDPFFMVILLKQLGKDFIVWDKAAGIQFKRPGRGDVFAEFHIPLHEIEQIRKDAMAYGKTEPHLRVQVKDYEGTLIADVEKLLYVRWKLAPQS
jgi:hypothetical protein